MSAKPVSRGLTPAGTSAHSRLYDQVDCSRTADSEDLFVCMNLHKEWPSCANSITTFKGTTLECRLDSHECNYLSPSSKRLRSVRF
jgi:hypothetical protein